MPFVHVPGRQIHYALTGSPSAPVLVLSNSLGTNFSMWDAQLPQFEKHFSVLRYDTRGHGQSSVPPGPYTFDQLGGDVVALLDALKISRAHFCGVSMGGMTGLWLGLHAAGRFHKLVLASTSAKFGTAEGWNTRIAIVRKSGMKSVAPQVVERWYTPEFRVAAPETARTTLQMLETTPPEGYAACCEALRDSDLRENAGAIRMTTLVISGAKDSVSPPADCKYLAEKISGAQYLELLAAHLPNIEASTDYTSAVLRFLTAEGA